MEQVIELLLGAARFSAQHVWTAILPGLGICVAVGLLLRFTRFLNAATRYVVCWTALLLVILLPGLLPVSTIVGSELGAQWSHLASGKSAAASSQQLTANEPAKPTVSERSTILSSGESVSSSLASTDKNLSAAMQGKDESPRPGTVERSASDGQPTYLLVDPRTSIPPAKVIRFEPAAAATTESTVAERNWTDLVPGLLPPLFLLVWVLGAAVLLIQLVRSWTRSRRLIDHASPASDEVMARTRFWQQRLGCTRSIDVRISREVGSPAAVGFKRGTVLLPARLMEQLTPPERDAVLLHEIVHLYRRDDRARLIEQLLIRLFFVNPLVHWLVRQLDLQREIACDDWVLVLTGKPGKYARALARVVELQDTTHALALAPGMFLSRKQIFSRFEMILDKRRSFNTGLARRTVTATVIGMAALVMVLSQVAPVVAVPGLQVDLAGMFDPGNEPIAQAEPVAGPEEFDADNFEVDAELLAAADMDEPYLVLSEPVASDPDVSPPAVVWSGDGTPGAVVVAPTPSGGSGYSYVRGLRDYLENGQKLMITMKGRVSLTDDNTGIADISRRGFVELIDDRDEPSRRLLVEKEDGDLVYLYRVDGRRVDLDSEGREWLAGLLSNASRKIERASRKSNGVVELYGSRDGREWSQSYYSGSVGSAYYALPPVPSVPSVGSVPSVPAVPSVGSVPSVPYAPATDLRDLSDYLEPLESLDLPALEIEEALDAVREAKTAYAEATLAGLESSYGLGHTMITDDDGHHIIFSDHRGKMSIEYDGDIEFSDDDRSVKSISPGGYLEVEERRGIRRKLVIESDSDGELDYIYYERRRETDFDEDAQEWFGDVLLEVIRNTGLGAESRVNRIRGQSGVDGVLEEIDDIESDYVKRKYYTVLLQSGPMSPDELRTVLRDAGAELDSDFEKAELLIATTDYIKKPKEIADAYVEAVATIDSDFETRRVLTAILFTDDEQLDPEVVEQVLEIADDLDSDYERAELLIDLAPHLTSSESQLDLYLEAVLGLDSDFETRRVLRAMGLKRDLSPEQARVILDLASQMDSDYEKAELLIEFAHVTGDNPELLKLYLEAAATLDSDYETRRTLSEIGLKRGMEADNLALVLKMAERMDSDYEKAELLLSVADEAAASESLREAYLDCAVSLSSDFERSRVLSELIHKGDEDPEFLRKMLVAIDEISSDHERASLLRDLAEPVAEHEELEEDYLDVVEGLSSDYERDRLYREFYRSKRSNK